MTTITCDVREFNDAFVKFNKEIGDKSNNQESIGNLWKGLILHYIGLDGSDSDIERAATLIEVSYRGAVYRGWDLVEPDLSGNE